MAMELPSFIPLLASLPILFPWAAPSEFLPPAPSISVMPAKPQFLIGDTVSIVCAVPDLLDQDRIQGFRFFSTSGWVTDVRTSRRSFVHTFNITGPQDGGSHTCSYSVLWRGRIHAHSPDSWPVLIIIQDRPTQPNLTVTPSSITVEGQPLTFFCTGPPSGTERRFGFFQEEFEVTDGIWEGSGAIGVQLWVEKSSRNQTGNFSCRYEEMTEGRWIASYPSNVIQVIVKDRCPPPLLLVEPPSGVVAVGNQLRLTCTVPQRNFRRRFQFFRDGVEVTPDTGDISNISGTRDGSELLFLQISQKFSGNFSCRLEEEVGGAWLESPPSQDVAVVVRAPLPQPVLLLTPPLATSNGSRISLTCLVPSYSGHVRRRFHFFHDGSETTMSPQPQISITIHSAAGHFSCRYEEELDTGWVWSPASAAVTVPALFGLLPLVVSIVVGVALLLLVFLLAACLCWRRRGASHWRGLRPNEDTRTFPMGNLEVAA